MYYHYVISYHSTDGALWHQLIHSFQQTLHFNNG